MQRRPWTTSPALALLCTTAWAQNFPGRPVKRVVPHAPGGSVGQVDMSFPVPSAAVKERMAQQGVEATPPTPPQARKRPKAERPKRARLVKARGIPAEQGWA